MLETPFSLLSSTSKIVLRKHTFVLVVSSRSHGNGSCSATSGVRRNFVQGGGGSTNSVEDRENGDLGAVAP